MIGVAFALQHTFGTLNAVETTAFSRVVSDFARLHKIDIGAAGPPTTRVSESTICRSPASLRSAISTALHPYLLSAAQAAQLEARVYVEATELLTNEFVPFADIEPALREIASLHIPSAALSGGWPSIDQRKADSVGFGGSIVFAQNLGLPASAPAAFARVAQSLRLPAERIWFVGTDLRSEIFPAAATGMRTIWIDRNGEARPLSQTPPDATVTTFADVLGILSGPYTRGLLVLRDILRTVHISRPTPSVTVDDTVAPVADGAPREERS